METLLAQIEACLLAAAKPLSFKDLSKATDKPVSEISQAVEELSKLRNISTSGIHVVVIDDKAQLVSSPEQAQVVSKLAKDEMAPELTRPSLEALTIIAYRGPVTKPEIEAIRGVNCSLILRNLLMRGLIEEREDGQHVQPVYTLSSDCLRYLGLHNTTELPDYSTLHANAQIDKLLANLVSETPEV